MASNKTRTGNKTLAKAIRWAGSREELALECRVTADAVRRWERLGYAPRTASRLISLLMDVPTAERRLSAR